MGPSYFDGETTVWATYHDMYLLGTWVKSMLKSIGIGVPYGIGQQMGWIQTC
jgi:thiamine pyrophosphate-dependent acetolactate synthase large subunit-like protein